MHLAFVNHSLWKKVLSPKDIFLVNGLRMEHRLIIGKMASLVLAVSKNGCMMAPLILAMHKNGCKMASPVLAVYKNSGKIGSPILAVHKNNGKMASLILAVHKNGCKMASPISAAHKCLICNNIPEMINLSYNHSINF